MRVDFLKGWVSKELVAKWRVPKWAWWAGAAFIALHIYFFQELLAAELIFGIVFGSFLLLVLAVYLVTEAGDRGLGWMETNGRVAAKMARHQWVRVEAISKKTFRRPHSESAR
ncbi:MAG TPA: hypothetical protein VMV59_04720 [Candidatus Dormibacteraeota bacterium]|nr:hypothetical protein [Candidatus Dormibacteraeota bacterium]